MSVQKRIAARLLLTQLFAQTTRSNTLRRSLSSSYDPRCHSVAKFRSLKTTSSELSDPDCNLRPWDLRLTGVEMKLAFYDSHRFDSSIAYNQSSIPTVLLLPSSETPIEQHAPLIANLVGEKYRVLALKFPGWGENKLLESEDSYRYSLFQKVLIVHDFLKLLLPIRRTALNSAIGFNDNSFVLLYLSAQNDIHYVGHKSLVMVNPLPPNHISQIKVATYVHYLSKSALTWPLFKRAVMKKIDTCQQSRQETFNLYRTWRSIDEKLESSLQPAGHAEISGELKKTHLFSLAGDDGGGDPSGYYDTSLSKRYVDMIRIDAKKVHEIKRDELDFAQPNSAAYQTLLNCIRKQ